MWSDPVPARKEMDNAASSFEQHESASSVVFEMLAANSLTLLPLGEKPMVVSPLGLVPEPRTGSSGHGEHSICHPALGFKRSSCFKV